jgi:hypothetical protein
MDTILSNREDFLSSNSGSPSFSLVKSFIAGLLGYIIFFISMIAAKSIYLDVRYNASANIEVIDLLLSTIGFISLFLFFRRKDIKK